MRTLRKAGRVLRLFTAETPEWTLSEVARAEGISTSGAHDLLDGLVQTGLLSRVFTRSTRNLTLPSRR